MSISPLGVVIVTFNSEEIILDCLESLLNSQGVPLRICVVDNASTDATVKLIRDWAAGKHAFRPSSDLPIEVLSTPKPISLNGDVENHTDHSIKLLAMEVNAGFAAGVNAGLAFLEKQPEISRFWILNPDCVTPVGTAKIFATFPEPEGGFSLLGGRVLYLDRPENIQFDGGTINRKTGVTGNLNLGKKHTETPPITSEQMDFVTGASMVASRKFYETAGPMREDFFLYYEEVDWALRRQDLPLAYCPSGIVYHRAGTAIGSPTLWRPAAPFSLYFKHRNRRRFVKQYFPRYFPMALAYSAAKSAQLLIRGYPREAYTIMIASIGFPPSKAIRQRLSKAAQNIAFRDQNRDI